MSKRRWLSGSLLMAGALIIMTLPVSEADAASSASDFVIEGGTLVKYRGTETNVSVPSTVEVIGESAFEDKTGVELVVVPNSVKKIEAYAFWGCDNLDTVVLGKGMTEIGDYTFAGCKGLEQMVIPSNITSIGIQAFGDCENMTDISIPEETVEIHESAFNGCVKLNIHCSEGTVADSYAKEFYERQKNMVGYVPDNGSGGEGGSPGTDAAPEPTPTAPPPQPTEAPYDESGTVLGSTQVVGNGAVVFMNASGLRVIQDSSSASGNGEAEEGTGVSENQGQPSEGGADGSGNAGQPSEEGYSADSIAKYTIVDGKIVADQAYYRDASLQNITLPEGITEIGQFSFARSALTEIKLPEGVTDIAYGAFYHCDSLRAVTIPESVMNVEPKAFSNTGWIEGFLADASAGDFLVSGGVLAAYRGEDAEISIPDGVRVIAAEVFQGHTEIEKVIFPDSVKVVGEAAFSGCTGLREVHLNQGLEKIKDRAFCGDAGLELMVPATVKELGLRALEGVKADYEGEIPGQSYEFSATRLLNEAYRGISGGDGGTGVTVVGSDMVQAELNGAARHYKLTVRQPEDDGRMKKAWERTMEKAWPESMMLYGLELTDDSGIPLTRLGQHVLTVTIPLSGALKGQEVKAVTIDRNGQLEAVAAKRCLLENGEEALSIRTGDPSLLGIYGTGNSGQE